ncbi:MAG TPA: ComEA family DNA-binding protein [Thermodesulfobacteriota bacterium]|nr:ComEA family DNA-binding protein [Thermodesulfobacteriota bacterium]
MKKIAHDSESRKRNNSLLYLALLCLLIFLAQTYYPFIFPRDTGTTENRGGIYIEIDDGRSSVVKAVETPVAFNGIKQLYNVTGELKSGDKVILDDGEIPRTGRISGIKSISLGIPIGINSATAEDLEALPGIGEKLALRIVDYRNEYGKFQNVDALLEVNGMGEKKLSRIKPYTNLD